MAGRKLFCTKCDRGIVIKTDELPDACPYCGSGAWRSANDPEKPYTLTEMDKRFLKSIRVDADG
jgi:predicted RNA-binding Zn-ribbon protein involved in translation (DUF1610 family)